MSTKPIRYCQMCGKQLKNKQVKFCSNECFHGFQASTEKIYKCQVCGKDIRTTGGRERKYCSNECSFTARRGSKIKTRVAVSNKTKNRPFTEDTAYLIRLWYKQGTSKKTIANILNRSLKNIEQAFV